MGATPGVDWGSAFRRNAHLFEQYTHDLRQSAEYGRLGAELHDLLVLGDRVLAACEGHPEVGRVPRRLANALDAMAPEADRASRSEDIDLEKWLKALLWFVSPDRYEALRANPARFNLFAALRELRLLTADELNLDVRDFLRIPDPVRQLLLIAKEDRNPDIHNPGILPPEVVDRMPRARLVTLVAALFKHRTALAQALEGLITRGVDAGPEVASMLRAVASDRRGHLQRFGGRREWIETLTAQLLPAPREKTTHPYVLLTANEGSGKTALASRISAELAAKAPRLGRNSSTVHEFDWLPGPLLHLGKCASSPLDITRSLVAQANAMLLDPIAMPAHQQSLSDYSMPTHGLGFRRAGRRRRTVTGVCRMSRRASPGSSRFFMADLDCIEDVSTPGPAKPPGTTERCRWAIQDVLERLVAERGSATVILDAIDEIDRTGEGLTYLPYVLPPGVTFLLTGRRGVAEQAFVRTHQDVDILELKELSRIDVPEITGVPDDSPPAVDFNDQVWSESGGWAIVVSAVGAKVQRAGGRFDQGMIEPRNCWLDRQAEQWEQPPDPHAGEVLRSMLPLLAIFEPCCPLDLQRLQSYLASRGLDLRLPDLKRCLSHVASQLVGLESDSVKLGLNAFSRYCLRRHFGLRDLRDAMAYIVTWLSEDDDVDPVIMAALLLIWLVEPDDDRPDLSREAKSLVERLARQNSHDRISSVLDIFSTDDPVGQALLIGLHVCAEAGYTDAMAVLGEKLIAGRGLPRNEAEGERLLRSAASQNNTMAMLFLASALVDGNGLLQNAAEGERLLREAVAKGDSDAMRFLGVRLLDGNGLPQNVAEGERFLRDAVVKGDPYAMWLLAERLIDGIRVQQDAVEGERLLRELVAKGNAAAMWTLGLRFLDGNVLPLNPAEGERLLRAAAEKGDFYAMGLLAEFLLEGNVLPPNPKEGERLLRAAVEQGDANAMRILGVRLLDGAGVPQNVAEGERLIRDAVVKGDPYAMWLLAERLIDGNRVQQDAVEGERVLRELVAKGDAAAMWTLGLRFLDGNVLPLNPAEGERLLRAAAEKGDFYAMGLLAEFLLEGNVLPPNPKEGERLLRAAVEQGDANAMRILGVRLLDGAGVPQNVAEGERLLRDAVVKGDAYAMGSLAERLLDGNRVQQDAVEGERLLRELVAKGNARAMWTLGMRLLVGKALPLNPAEGERLLRGAVDKGDTVAMRLLSDHLITGDVIPRNVDEGVRLLRSACEKDDADAMAALGNRLIAGDGVQQDVIEGERLLRAAVDKGDSDAMWFLGQALIDGAGVPRDATEGERLLRAAVDKGHASAMWILGMRLLVGKALPLNPAEGERLLREAAEKGDANAMWFLGTCLLDGSGLPKNVSEGENLLRNAVAKGSTAAMRILGQRRFVGNGLPADAAEGERLLRSACEAGDAEAMRFLGEKLLGGDGVEQNVLEGERLLRAAGDKGDVVAMRVLGEHLIEGDILPRDEAEGERLLIAAAEQDADAASTMGYRRYVAGDFAEATRLFLMAFRTRSGMAGLNLAYMARRGEIPDGFEVPPFDECLSAHLDRGDSFALLNLALCHAAGVGRPMDWMEADRLIATIDSERCEDALKWWAGLAQRNDPEGHVVLGWIARHGLAEDPDGLAVDRRMALARSGGWAVPDWLSQPVSNP